MEQKRQDRTETNRKGVLSMQGWSAAQTRSQTKPVNGSFWGEKAVHYVLDLLILVSTLQKFSPDVKQ